MDNDRILTSGRTVSLKFTGAPRLISFRRYLCWPKVILHELQFHYFQPVVCSPLLLFCLKGALNALYFVRRRCLLENPKTKNQPQICNINQKWNYRKGVLLWPIEYFVFHLAMHTSWAQYFMKQSPYQEWNEKINIILTSVNARLGPRDF